MNADGLEAAHIVPDRVPAEVLADPDRQQHLSAGKPFVDLRQLRGVDDRDLLVRGSRRIDDDVEREFCT